MIYKGGIYPFWYIYGNRVFIKAFFILYSIYSDLRATALDIFARGETIS